MAHFMISYDLHNQRNYPPVWQTLESWGAVRLLESLWVLTINTSSAVLRDQLHAVADSDDSIVVIELKPGSQWNTWNGRSAGVSWMKTSIGT